MHWIIFRVCIWILPRVFNIEIFPVWHVPKFYSKGQLGLEKYSQAGNSVANVRLRSFTMRLSLREFISYIYIFNDEVSNSKTGYCKASYKHCHILSGLRGLLHLSHRNCITWKWRVSWSIVEQCVLRVYYILYMEFYIKRL